MKYDITHSCGCVETVDIIGSNTHGERDRKIAWLESKPCRECEHKAAVEKANAEGMAELEGSEKQIAWALDIRRDMIAKIEEMIEENAAKSAGKFTDEQVATARANVAKAITNIKAVREAKWFIDNRLATAQSLFNTAFFLDEK